MTGVFIPGMSIPEHCGRCPLLEQTRFLGDYRCFVNGCDITGYINGLSGRHYCCPMEEKEEENERN